jgi:undecaprenyl-diphosphatase
MSAQGSRLADLRHEIRAQVGLPDPARPPFPPAGVPARAIAAAGVLAVLVGVPVLGGVADVLGAVQTGGWRWLGAAVALAILARGAMAAAALSTVDRRLALGRTYGAAMVADGATVLHGRNGWRRAAARYLERAGVRSDTAHRSIDRFTAGAVVAAVLVAVATLALTIVEGRLTAWRAPAALVPAVLLGIGACALVLLAQWLASRTDPLRLDRAARGSVRAALQEALTRTVEPGGAGAWHRGRQVGWAVLAVLLEGATLAAALHAFGGDLPVLETASVYAVLHLLWSVLPLTGTPGAADLLLLLALTALGAPLAPSCAAVLAFRLLTFWVPAAAGALLGARFERRLLL